MAKFSIEHFHSHATTKLSGNFHRLFRRQIPVSFLFRTNPFWIQLFYFLSVSAAGFLALKLSKTPHKNLDVLFTSVSAATVSSMSTVEMEDFKNSHLIIITILMLLGGEVFTSMLSLQFARLKFRRHYSQSDHICAKSDSNNNNDLESTNGDHETLEGDVLKYNSIKLLGYVVLGYLVTVHTLGSTLVSLYISLVPSARRVLRNKGIQIETFSVFTTVSTFANCGFVPTNENMVVFKRNSGLLLLLVPQILMGNTLYPFCLRFLIWVLEKVTGRVELRFMLRKWREMGYDHLLSESHCWFLGLTALGFVLVQFVVFCWLEWSSGVMDGVGSGYQRVVGAFFQTVNSRHSGESVFDLSTLSPAILVLFIVMMYLPPYTTFYRITDQKNDEMVSSSTDEDETEKPSKNQRKSYVKCLIFSQLSYLVIFVILICITERQKMKEDPLNFNVLNITFEVISAYGNVGFSIGYSCKREVRAERDCKDMTYGFAGRWSPKGKIILIFVMLFGRLKKFNMRGGQAWNLS